MARLQLFKLPQSLSIMIVIYMELLLKEVVATVPFSEDKNFRFKFIFSRVYGPSGLKERKKLQELGAVTGIRRWQWVLGGDFNITRFDEERTGMATNTRGKERIFQVH
ncbi:hypothetical protein HAX54_001711 [Datura stramonium]|uniref:Uncharacterized protein n=1 Tax=Datura stramonium TaxID=4076 RepID=A0ABS8T3F7_DATST|nr:hypothetical protein [Datura stramonium]